MDCIFCKIIKGEIPASKIYEDDKVLAFLDIKPVNFGHTLIITKEHFQTMADVPDELLAYVFRQVKKLLPVIKKVMRADFIAITILGIEVPHFHVHLIPRYFNDGLDNFWPTKKYEGNDMNDVAKKITAFI